MNVRIEEKIIQSIEKLSLLLRYLLVDSTKGLNLTSLQSQILLYVGSHGKEFSKVSNLAKEFQLRDATVSDSIKILRKKRLIKQEKSKSDKRVSYFVLSKNGKNIFKKIRGYVEQLKNILEGFPKKTNVSAMLFFMEFIRRSKMNGLISVERMCLTCENFEKDMNENSEIRHFCKLTGREMSDADLRLDCPKHK